MRRDGIGAVIVKWWAFAGELIGFLSSILLVWAYTPPKGTMTWISGDEGAFQRGQKFRAAGAKVGFATLALSFLIQAAVTLISD
jgi:hypothetical protein